MVTESPIIVDMKLSSEDMQKILSKMLEIDFFSYPEVLESKTTSFVIPVVTYEYQVDYQGKQKNLSWTNKLERQKDLQTQKLEELNNLIINIIKSQDEFKQLPEPKGGYL